MASSSRTYRADRRTIGAGPKPLWPMRRTAQAQPIAGFPCKIPQALTALIRAISGIGAQTRGTSAACGRSATSSNVVDADSGYVTQRRRSYGFANTTLHPSSSCRPRSHISPLRPIVSAVRVRAIMSGSPKATWRRLEEHKQRQRSRTASMADALSQEQARCGPARPGEAGLAEHKAAAAARRAEPG